MGKWSSIARAALITLSQLLFQSSPDQRQAVQAEMISMNGVLLLSNILCPPIASTAKAASSKSCEHGNTHDRCIFDIVIILARN